MSHRMRFQSLDLDRPSQVAELDISSTLGVRLSYPPVIALHDGHVVEMMFEPGRTVMAVEVSISYGLASLHSQGRSVNAVQLLSHARFALSFRYLFIYLFIYFMVSCENVR